MSSSLLDYKKTLVDEGREDGYKEKPWRVTAVASPSKSSHYRGTQWKVLVAA